jgi:hypothetical protein
MATLTLNVPDTLAERVEPFSRWLPTILEISLLGLTTPAARTASEIVTFLASNPSEQTVQDYHVSEQAQIRIDDLLEKNRKAILNENELKELDELLELEHVIIMLKASLPSKAI